MKFQEDNIEELIHLYKPMVFRVAMGFMHDAALADEIVQDCFVRVYEQLSSFRGECHVSTWIYRICCNLCISYQKKHKRELRIDTMMNYVMSLRSGDDQHASVVQSELHSEIKRAIQSLPFLQQQAFVLKYYEELSQAEIAHIMHKSEGSVEQLLQRAKASLKIKLKNYHS